MSVEDQKQWALSRVDVTCSSGLLIIGLRDIRTPVAVQPAYRRQLTDCNAASIDQEAVCKASASGYRRSVPYREYYACHPLD